MTNQNHTIIEDHAYMENIRTLLYDSPRFTLGNDITVINRDPEGILNVPQIRLVVPMHLADSPTHRAIRNLAFELVETILSESTNNDACRVSVIETSAHFDSYDHMAEWHNAEFGSIFIIDAEVEDYLT